MKTTNEMRRQALEKARDIRRASGYYDPVPIDRSKLPSCLQDLAEDAEVLGASDEGVQADMAKAVSVEYVRDLERRYDAVQDSLEQWLAVSDDVPPAYERVAFINLVMLLESFSPEERGYDGFEEEPPNK